MKSNGNGNNGKGKAPRLDMTQLIVLNAHEKVFSSGKRGWFGKVQDPRTGRRYQVTAAVEIGS